MRKFIFLSLLSCCLLTSAKATIDSTSCTIYGPPMICYQGTPITVRYAALYNAAASYSWSVTGANAQIVGPRNLSYVDVYITGTGSFKVCLAYAVDGSDPCCLCKDVLVTICDPCCINYVNSTFQAGYIKVKFQVCSQGVVQAKLFSSGTLIWTDTWPSGYNPAYTYNLNIPAEYVSCERIFCLKICGYKADGTECCTANFAIHVLCDYYGNPNGVENYNYPGCNSGGGGGGGLPIEKSVLPQTQPKQKMSLNPNPVSGNLSVNLPAKNNIRTLQIVDRNGNIAMIFVAGSKQSLTISTGSLKPGTYFIKTDDPNVETGTFIKQ